MSEGSQRAARVYTWDWPTRLVHWLLVAALACAWASAELGRLYLHRVAGYAALGLVLFRLYWGFSGTSTSRFTSFVVAPRTVIEYLRAFRRGESHATAGHNPAGGWSALALLALILLQATLGVFSVDADGIESGPLSRLVSFATGRRVAALHELNFNVLATFVIVHVAAVIAHQVHRGENLLVAMFTGHKRLPGSGFTSIVPVPAWRAWLGAALATLVVLGVAYSADLLP